MMLTATDFDSAPDLLSTVELPKPYAPNRREYQRTSAKLLKQELTELGHVLEVRYPDRDLRSERMKAERRVASAESRIAALREQIAVAEGGLGRSLVAIEEIMESFGFAESWRLSDRGKTLQSIFHEMDLLTALCIDEGLLEDVTAAELAALVSVLTYEHRSRLDPPPPWFPNQNTKKKAERIMAYSRQIRAEEAKRGLPETREPDPTIFGQVHGWASGHELSDVLDDDTPAGDFVRNIRQVVDLLGQLADCSPSLEL
jgi:ATP-dependent RNA helicase HelY